MILTSKNYYSQEANKLYMSNSQYKDFQKCEAMAMAKVNGQYAEPSTMALLVGGYVDAYFSGEMSHFLDEHPEVYKKRGDMYAEFIHADKIIERIKRDPKMMEYLSGIQQVIFTGWIGGVEFKIRMDSYFPGVRIVDGKTMKDFKPVWVEGIGKLPFIEAWGYDLQGAIYQEVERHNFGSPLPFFIAAATKEPTTDLLLLELPQHKLNDALALVEHFAPLYAAIKRGEKEPRRCEHCDYCKQTRIITEPMDYQQFLNQYGGGEYSDE